MLARIPAFLLLSSVLLTAQGAPPPPPDDAAWKGGIPVPPGAIAIVGTTTVPVDVFIEETAARNLRTDNPAGRETLETLIDETLVAAEAGRRGITPTEAELDRRIQEIDCQLRQHKTCLAAEMQSKGVSMDLFRAKLRMQVALERLTREDQRVAANDPVTNDQQKIWLKSRRDATTIELDRTKLKRGETALVGDTPIDDRTFVKSLLATSEKKYIRGIADFLMQYAFATNLLEQAGAPLTDADVDQEYAERKQMFESNPEYRGIQYEQIVKDQTGLEPPALKKSRVFRMHAAVSKLARTLFSATDVKGFYDANLGLFGPRYTVRHLLIMGSDRPVRDIAGRPVQSLAQARQQIENVRAEIAKGKPFEDVVKLYSEHMPTKLQGGLLKAFTPRTAPQQFPELGEAVTKLEIGTVSEPLLTSAGYHLVRVERMDPAPQLSEVEHTIRQTLGKNYFGEAYQKAPKGWDIRLE